MFFAVILGIIFSIFHFLFQLPADASIVGAGILTVVFWVIWKMRWIILGILGLEMLFGGGGDGGDV